MPPSLQDQFAPNLKCFGCGPKNSNGLQLKSFVDGDQVVATWQPQAKHQAFENVLNGGIVGALLDCHGNWTACWTLMQQHNAETPPCCVTAKFTVNLLAPTPLDQPLSLRAWALETSERRANIEAEMSSGGVVTATFEGVFVAVKPGHPGYHRW